MPSGNNGLEEYRFTYAHFNAKFIFDSPYEINPNLAHDQKQNNGLKETLCWFIEQTKTQITKF